MSKVVTKLSKEATESMFARLDSGELKLYKVAEAVKEYIGVADETVATRVRREYVEHKYGIDLSGVSRADMNKLSHDGLALGVYGSLILKYAGEIPIRFQFEDGGEVTSKRYPVFMMVNEGKVASGTYRGIEALKDAERQLPGIGGITAVVVKDSMTRDNLVEVDNLIEANKLRAWIESDVGQRFLKEQYDKLPGHSKLMGVEVDMHGNHVHLIYRAKTGAAMGMNAVTQNSTYVTRGMKPAEVEELKKKVKSEDELAAKVPESLFHKVTTDGIITGNIRMLTASGNECTDKKQSARNMIYGRGVSVETEVVLPIEVVKSRFFKNTDLSPIDAAKLLVKVATEKNERGTRFAGSLSSNSSVSNPQAGMFAAHGQDMAQVVESSQAIITFDLSDDGKNVIIHGSFPVTEVGTVGGETGWGIQTQILKAEGLNWIRDRDGSTRKELAILFGAVATTYEFNMLGTQSADELGGTKDFRIRKE